MHVADAATALADELIGTADLIGQARVVMDQQDRGRLALQDQLDANRNKAIRPASAGRRSIQ